MSKNVLTAEEFQARNGRLSVIDKGSQRDADLDAWSLWLAAYSLCQRSDLQLSGKAKKHMRRTIVLLTDRLGRMK